MSANLDCYLRPYRRRSGLSQGELAMLLGLKAGASVSRLERGLRRPSLETAYGIELILGVAQHELFPGLHAEVREQVNARTRTVYDALQGNNSRVTKLKLDLFEQVFERFDKRQ